LDETGVQTWLSVASDGSGLNVEHQYHIFVCTRLFDFVSSRILSGTAKLAVPTSLRVLIFESGSQLHRIERPILFEVSGLFVLFPASLEYIDGYLFPYRRRDGIPLFPIYAFEPGNRCFTINDHTIMDSARTRIIRYFGEESVTPPIDPMVEELGVRSFYVTPIKIFAFPEP
jgi:hypothetical protein